MYKIIKFPLITLLISTTFLFSGITKIYAEESTTVLDEIDLLKKDIKTLEKAVYSKDVGSSNSNSEISSDSSDILTKHLLKLSELEEQFQNLTNQFEEINFRLDKLSNRITKIQTDNQVRFQDIENSGISSENKSLAKKEKKLPGSSEPQDLGGLSETEVAAIGEVQKTQSVGSTGTVLTEKAERVEKLLPDASPEKQYEFAISFIKVGDYETAEFALKEFVDTNPKHKLAGNAQYWYGETFRVRQLYQDAATAYLDAYQKYPQSAKAPINLLKLGVMLVQIGEKDQGCSMILGVKDQYPEANQSIIQKAEYEKKKFSCKKS